MGNLHLIEQDYIFKFSGIAYHSSFSNDGAAPDKGTVADLRFLVHDGRTVDISGRRNFGRFCNPHIFSDFVEFICRKRISQLYDKSLDFR